MATIHEKITLHISPEAAWRYIFDKKKLLQWRTDIKRFEIDESKPPRAGMTFFIEKDLNGKRVRFDCKIVRLEPDRKFGFEGEAAGVAKVNALYEVIPKKEGCEFVITETVDVLNLGFLKPLIDRFFIKRGLSRTIKGFLENLRNLTQ